jgi:hypothetical protein
LGNNIHRYDLKRGICPAQKDNTGQSNKRHRKRDWQSDEQAYQKY